MRPRVAVLLVLVLLFSLCAWGQSAPPTQEPPKKKARKVWTNDDFGSSPDPVVQEEKAEATAPAPPSQAEKLFAELDAAKADLAGEQETLALYRGQLEQLAQRRQDADNDYDRDMYARAIGGAESEIATTEATVKQLEARIAELEKLTKGLKRPKPKPVEKKAAEPPAAPPPEMVNPAGGPIPTKEPAPPPPPPPSF